MRSKNVLQFPLSPAMSRVHYDDLIRNEFASNLVSEENTGEFIEFAFKGQPFGNTNGRYEEVCLY
jgi:hypothetical protein